MTAIKGSKAFVMMRSTHLEIGAGMSGSQYTGQDEVTLFGLKSMPAVVLL